MTTPSRSCWECVRRRRVCDKTIPYCKKCEASGTDCPGYGDRRPLVFVPSGRRPRKNRPNKTTSKPHCSPAESPEHVAVTRMRLPALTNPKSLRTQDCDFIDAINFLNAYRAHLFLDTIFEHHPYFAAIPYDVLAFPPSILHSMSAIALHQRRSSFGIDHETSEKNQLMIRLLQHKRRAIKGLNSEIGQKGSEGRSLTVTSINCLHQAEVVCAKDPDWRPHARALAHIHDQQAASAHVKEHDPLAQSALVKWLFTTVVANTTSPAKEQIFAATHVKHLRRVEAFCGTEDTPFPHFPCPPPLLRCIVRINILRSQSCESPLCGIERSFGTVMRQLEAFDATRWASDREEDKHLPVWCGIARLFQLAAQVFACASLATFSICARSYRDQHIHALAHAMFDMFRQLPLHPSVWLAVLWPLVVAGFTAGVGGRDERAFVREKCRLVECVYGFSAVSNALDTLQEFWRSEDRKEWDECFDKPRALIV